MRRLIRQAASLSQASEIRTLVDRVERAAQDTTVETTAQWVQWALRVADSLDPTSEIVQRLAAGSDPSEPEHQDLYPDRRY